LQFRQVHMAISAAVCAAWAVAQVLSVGAAIQRSCSLSSLLARTRFRLMLPCVQQDPDLSSRLAFEDTSECGAASNAGVVLLNLGGFHFAGSHESQRIVRINR